jgi:hypothetical protein
MPTWELIDLAEPNRVPIPSVRWLRSELWRLAERGPRLVLLVSAPSEMLGLALCDPVAMAYWSPGPCVLRHRVLRAVDIMADEHILLDPQAVLPLQDAIELAAFVCDYEQLPIWVGADPTAEVLSGITSEPLTIPRTRVLQGICVLHSQRSCGE